MSNYSIKCCIVCDKEYKPNSSAALYCTDCALKISSDKAKDRSVAYRIKKFDAKPIGSELICKLCNCSFEKKNTVEHYCDKCKNIKRKTKSARVKINENMRRKYRENQVVLVKTRFRNILAQALRRNKYGKKSKANEILGCSWDKLKAYIESQFQQGMTWENRSAWHIDHIIPLASAKTEEDVIRLNHYTNLQPLWAADNLRKSDKLEYQP